MAILRSDACPIGVGPPACRGEQQDRREGGGADRCGPGKQGQFLSGEPLGQLSLGSPESPVYGEARQDVRDGPVGPMRLRGGDSKANGNFDVGPVDGQSESQMQKRASTHTYKRRSSRKNLRLFFRPAEACVADVSRSRVPGRLMLGLVTSVDVKVVWTCMDLFAFFGEW